MIYFKQIMRSVTVTLAIILVLAANVLAKPYTPDSIFVEPEQISQLLPDPQVQFDTPGFAVGKEGFTTHEEMMKFIYDLQQKSSNMKVKIIGYSQEGREIPILIFSNINSEKPADILKLNKPIVWLQGQQHGNEPAGGEAMLTMAQRLATGSLGKEFLDKISVVIVPRCNPDGSYYFGRRTANGIDINRDNIKFDLPETQLLHKEFNQFHPEVVIDAHEYSGNGDFKDVGPNGKVSYYDMLLLSSTNLNVPEKITSLADDLLISNAEKYLGANQFTYHWYYEVGKSTTGAAKKITMASGEPIIGRNAYGLQPAISILAESRGIGIGKQHFARRVQGHVLTHTSFLKTIGQNADIIKKTIDEARREIVDKGNKVDKDDTVIISAEPVILIGDQFELIDKKNGTIDKIDVEAYTYKGAKSTLERVRPYAYIMPAAYHNIAQKLLYSGAMVRTTTKPVTLTVETYKVTGQKVESKYFEGHYRNFVKTEVTAKTVEFAAGSYVYYMNQPTANLIAVSLEPEAASSFVTYNYLPVNIGDEVPVYRFMEELQLETKVVEYK